MLGQFDINALNKIVNDYYEELGHRRDGRAPQSVLRKRAALALLPRDHTQLQPSAQSCRP
eukprot:SAG31_NODE_377_length_16533_cov_99.867957_6_plen_60_part_00